MEQGTIEGEWVDIAEVQPIDKSEARLLTDRIKERAEELWHLLLEAYERNVHGALNYKSWGEYFKAEFGGSKSRAYELIDAGRVVRAIEAHSGMPERPNARQADELAPLAKQAPEEAAAIWDEVIQEHGSDVTAADVREAVAKKAQDNRDLQALPAEFVEILQDLQHAGCTRVVNDDDERERLWKIYTNSGLEEATEIASIIAGDDKPDIRSVFAAEKYLKNKRGEPLLPKKDMSPGRKWSSAMYEIQVRLNSIRDLGGIEAMTGSWTPEDKQALGERLATISQTLGEFAHALIGGEK